MVSWVMSANNFVHFRRSKVHIHGGMPVLPISKARVVKHHSRVGLPQLPDGEVGNILKVGRNEEVRDEE